MSLIQIQRDIIVGRAGLSAGEILAPQAWIVHPGWQTAKCLITEYKSKSHAAYGADIAEESASALVTRDSTIPTPTEAYEAMIALKDREEYKVACIVHRQTPMMHSPAQRFTNLPNVRLSSLSTHQSNSAEIANVITNVTAKNTYGLFSSSVVSDKYSIGSLCKIRTVL
mgnify:CR=1 FL=1